MRLSARLSTRLAAFAAMFCLAVPLGIAGAGRANSAEITIFLNQATASGVRELGAGFEQATGHKVNVSFERGPALNEKITSDAPGDLASMLVSEFDGYLKSGKVVAGSVIEYGRVFNGVAVKAGAAKPDISTPEAFKRAMLDAASIGHTLSGTGPYNTRLFQRLGIYEQIKDKIKIVPPGTLVAAAVARGDVEIGIQQANVIQPYPGTEYLGPLPPALVEYGHAGVGLLAVSRQQEVANAFIKFMTDPANAALLRKGSMEPPER
jgi:molybdate transport system substrate-binding protein